MTRFFLIILFLANASAIANVNSPNDSKGNMAMDEEQIVPKTPPTYENGILAIVNNDVITAYDLQTHLRMVTQGNVNNIPKDRLPSVRQALLKQLIDEVLMLQAIERMGLTVTAQEIEEAISNIEQAQNLPAGKIHRDMKAIGISSEIYQRRFKAQIGWNKYIRQAFTHVVQASEKDIEEGATLHQNKPRYLLSEIRLMFIKPEHLEPARKEALKLISHLEHGASFVDAAQQMSHAPSALNGGDIGWVLETQLPCETADILRTLPLNGITPPILNKDKTAYTIYMLRDRVIPGETASTFVIARQMNIKIGQDADSQEKLESLQKKFDAITNCHEFDALEDQIPGAELNIYNEVRLSDMSKDLQAAVKDVPVGQVSRGIINGEDNTIVFFLVCKRYESAIPPEARSEASDILTGRRLSLIAEQKLHDLQRSSLVDVRI